MKRIVLDASAMMTLFESRPGSEAVEKTIDAAMSGQAELLMSIVSWGEIFYSVWRVNGRDAAKRRIAEIAHLPIDLVDVDLHQVRSAVEFTALRKLPYADAFVAALAKKCQASILTADKDFSRVENEFDILWAI